MEYLAGWWAVIWSAASSCFDLVWRCSRVTLSATAEDSTAPVTFARPIYMFQTMAPENTICGKKNDWLKNRLFL